jgi:hypothetical protein
MAAQSRVEQYVPRRVPAKAPDPFSRFTALNRQVESFSVSDVDANLLSDAISSWVGRGFAITFGRTSDGGAIGVHLLANGSRRPSYHATAEELETFLSEIVASGQASVGQ